MLLIFEMPAANKRYSKCGFIRFAHESASLSCVFVETFEILTYICAGRQLSNNLFPHLL